MRKEVRIRDEAECGQGYFGSIGLGKQIYILDSATGCQNCEETIWVIHNQLGIRETERLNLPNMMTMRGVCRKGANSRTELNALFLSKLRRSVNLPINTFKRQTVSICWSTTPKSH